LFSVLAIYGGYPTFVIAIAAIGGCTAIIGDVAGHLGCFIYLKDGVNAIAFVALGTSVPGADDFLCSLGCLRSLADRMLVDVRVSHIIIAS